MFYLKIILIWISMFLAIGNLFLNKSIERPTLTFGLIVLLGLAAIGATIIEVSDKKERDDAYKKLDEIHTTLIKEHQKNMKEEYEFQKVTGRLIPPYIATDADAYQVVFGSNTFIGTPNILVVNDIPLITMKVVNDALLVSATIYDDEGQVLALIRDNEWIFERDEGLKKEARINSLKIWDGNHDLILDCELLSNKKIKLNGIFRKDGSEIIATDAGLHVKSAGKGGVGLG